MRVRTLAASAALVFAVAGCGTAASPSAAGGGASPAASVAPSESAPAASESMRASAAASESAGASAASPEASGSAASPGASLNQVIAVLRAENSSGFGGGAYVTEVRSGVSVSVGVVAPGVTSAMPAAIFTEACAPTLSGSAAFKLNDVSGGASNTVIDTTLGALTSSPHVIAVFDKAGSTKVVACGPIGG